MNRTLSVERLYVLGNYQNIKFINTLSDIPEDKYTPEQLDKVYQDLFLACDIAYVEYKRNLEAMTREAVVDSLEYFKELKSDNLEKLNNPEPMVGYTGEQEE